MLADLNYIINYYTSYKLTDVRDSNPSLRYMLDKHSIYNNFASWTSLVITPNIAYCNQYNRWGHDHEFYKILAHMLS